MSTQLQLRRGPRADFSSLVGAPGELWVDTDDWSLWLMDGSTLGGHLISTGSGSVTSVTLTSTGNTVTLGGVGPNPIVGSGTIDLEVNNGIDQAWTTNQTFNGGLTVVSGQTLTLSGTLTDGTSSVGGSGQLLSSTGSGVQWVNAPSTSLTATYVGYGSGSNLLTGSQSFTYLEYAGQSLLSVGSTAGNLQGTIITYQNNNTPGAVYTKQGAGYTGGNGALAVYSASSPDNFDILLGSTGTLGYINNGTSYPTPGLYIFQGQGSTTLTFSVNSATLSTTTNMTFAGALTINGDPGTSGYVLTSQGSGNAPIWSAPSGSPGGSDTQIQYNSSGTFAGDPFFTFVTGAPAGLSPVVQLGIHGSETGALGILSQGTYDWYLSVNGTTPGQFIINSWDGSALTPQFSIGSDGGVHLRGNEGSAGQVLTSGGSGAAASWITPSLPSGGTPGQVLVSTGGIANFLKLANYSVITTTGTDILNGFSLHYPVIWGVFNGAQASETITFDHRGVFDGQILILKFNAPMTSLTLVPSGGDTIAYTPTSVVAGQSIQYIYDLATTTWY